MFNSVWHSAHNRNFKALILFLNRCTMLNINIEKLADNTIEVEELAYVGNVVLIVEDGSPKYCKISMHSTWYSVSQRILKDTFWSKQDPTDFRSSRRFIVMAKAYRCLDR